MSLQDLKLQDTYSSDTNDLITDFYNPILANAILYDRISGFFSPKVLALAARGFSELISSEGKIRLITSVKVDDSTFRLIQNGVEFNDELLDLSGFTAVSTYHFLQHLISFKLFGFEASGVSRWTHF